MIKGRRGGGDRNEKNNDAKIISSLVKRVDVDQFDPQIVGGGKPWWAHISSTQHVKHAVFGSS